MKSKLALSFIFALVMTVSCGKDNDNDSAPAASNPPPVQREEDNSRNRNVNRPIRYSAVEIFTSSDMLGFSRQIRMDLNRRPVILTGNFSNMVDENDNTGGCTFQVTLSEKQADKLEARADRLSVCTKTFEGEDEPIFLELKQISLTDTQGNIKTAQKNYFPEARVDQTYICKGRAAFYTYVKTILMKKLPVTCPTNSIDDI